VALKETFSSWPSLVRIIDRPGRIGVPEGGKNLAEITKNGRCRKNRPEAMCECGEWLCP